ncbi:MAG: GNAT family N-acetyltransferase [Gemmatimonadaceae bacterium]|jgi:GNAT superfamily N-acetyltransferase|nr:GNAT family N-acetyltransferase [Gemmatimonadaceae bacterium]
MATLRTWPTHRSIDGPFPLASDDIAGLNAVFTEAFSDRYRKDGMQGVRVPPLHHGIWRYAIADAADGALGWRDERDRIVAFNIVHRSGREGWMGPLCVHPELQSLGLGKEIVRTGIDWLKERDARVIGLETMPRTMDNIGFYSSLGFLPGTLTVTLTLEARAAERPVRLLSALAEPAREQMIARCHALLDTLAPGYDFSRELRLTDRLALGDTLLLGDGDALDGFALCHAAPLVEGRGRDELRVLKVALRDPERDLEAFTRGLGELARTSGARRVAIRVQSEYRALYLHLMRLGARVRWTDLRMALAGHEERPPAAGLVLSNWEI